MNVILKTIKDQWYIILPMVFLFFWAMLSLIKDNFILEGIDFSAFYNAATNIFINPENVYSSGIYRYLPSFATLFSIMTLFPFDFADWIMFFLLLFFGIFSIKILNDILVLKNIDRKINRFLFLFVFSNGIIITQTFDYLQTKIFVIFLFLLFLKREIRFRSKNEENISILKFKFIQFMILVFAIGMIPYLGFLLLIYLFNDLKIKQLFQKSQLYTYLILIIVFFIQNFMFIIYPVLILGFLEHGLGGITPFPSNLTPSYLLANELLLPNDTLNNFLIAFNIHIDYLYIALFSTGILLIISLVLIINDTLKIEEKFGYFILFSLFINMYARQNALIVFLPFILILFTKNNGRENRFFSYIKENYLFLIGLFLISILYFMPPLFYLYRVLPFLLIIPFPIMLMKNTLIYLLIFFDLYLLNRKKNLTRIKKSTF